MRERWACQLLKQSIYHLSCATLPVSAREMVRIVVSLLPRSLVSNGSPSYNMNGTFLFCVSVWNCLLTCFASNIGFKFCCNYGHCIIFYVLWSLNNYVLHILFTTHYLPLSSVHEFVHIVFPKNYLCLTSTKMLLRSL